MYAFIISQFIGLILFATVNYGALSYINYRKNQAIKVEEKKVEKFFLYQARLAVYLLFVIGMVYKINGIQTQIHIDPTQITFQAVLGGFNSLMTAL